MLDTGMLLLQPSNIIYRTQEKESLLLLLIFAILLIYLPSKHCKISFTISFPFQELSFAHSFRAGLLVTDCPLFLKAIFTGCRIKVDISSFWYLNTCDTFFWPPWFLMRNVLLFRLVFSFPWGTVWQLPLCYSYKTLKYSTWKEGKFGS